MAEQRTPVFKQFPEYSRTGGMRKERQSANHACRQSTPRSLSSAGAHLAASRACTAALWPRRRLSAQVRRVHRGRGRAQQSYSVGVTGPRADSRAVVPLRRIYWAPLPK